MKPARLANSRSGPRLQQSPNQSPQRYGGPSSVRINQSPPMRYLGSDLKQPSSKQKHRQQTERGHKDQFQANDGFYQMESPGTSAIKSIFSSPQRETKVDQLLVEIEKKIIEREHSQSPIKQISISDSSTMQKDISNQQINQGSPDTSQGVKQDPMRDLYNQTVSFKNELAELRKKIRSLSAFSEKYGEKFQVSLLASAHRNYFRISKQDFMTSTRPIVRYKSNWYFPFSLIPFSQKQMKEFEPERR